PPAVREIFGAAPHRSRAPERNAQTKEIVHAFWLDVYEPATDAGIRSIGRKEVTLMRDQRNDFFDVSIRRLEATHDVFRLAGAQLLVARETPAAPQVARARRGQTNAVQQRSHA